MGEIAEYYEEEYIKDIAMNNKDITIDKNIKKNNEPRRDKMNNSIDNIMQKLQAPFPENDIEWRVQHVGLNGENPWAMVIAYVDARAIQRRLDEVFGFINWKDEYRPIENNMLCRLSVRIHDEWISKENGANETQESAFKGGISSAFKRVASSGFGIGRYLYDLKEIFAECQLEKPKNMQGWKKAKIKDKKKTIYWKIPELPSWALPPVINEPNKITLGQKREIETKVKTLKDLVNKDAITIYEELHISDIEQLTYNQAELAKQKLTGWVKAYE